MPGSLCGEVLGRAREARKAVNVDVAERRGCSTEARSAVELTLLKCSVFVQ